MGYRAESLLASEAEESPPNALDPSGDGARSPVRSSQNPRVDREPQSSPQILETKHYEPSVNVESISKSIIPLRARFPTILVMQQIHMVCMNLGVQLLAPSSLPKYPNSRYPSNRLEPKLGED